MRLKLLAAVALIALGLGVPTAVVFGPTLTASSSPGYTTQAAAVGTVTARVTETGSLSATTTYGLRFGGGPDIVSTALTTTGTSGSTAASSLDWPAKTVSVAVGQQVKKGQVLATADDAAAQLQLATAQAMLATAQAKLATDQAAPDATTKAAAQDQVNQAQNQLDQATSNRTATQAQNALSLQQAQAAEAGAQAQLDADQAAAAPQSTIDADTTALAKAKSDLASTQLKASQSNQQAAQQVTSAQLSLTAARHQYAAMTAATPQATILADQAQVASQQASVDSAQAAANAASLVAPADGLVTVVNVTAGASAPSGEAIEMEVGPMVATISVAETDLPGLAAGQAASVTVTAAGVTVGGSVTTIAQTAESTGGGANSVVTYTVKITLNSVPATVLSGMAASVTVTTAEAQNVLAIPASALIGSASTGYTVRVLGTDGSIQTRSVQVGLVTSSLAQVKSGLSQGELVVLNTSSSSSSGSQNGFPGGGGLLGLPGL